MNPKNRLLMALPLCGALLLMGAMLLHLPPAPHPGQTPQTMASIPDALEASAPANQTAPADSLLNAVKQKDWNVLIEQIGRDPQINRGDINGWTALHYAAMAGDAGLVKLLLRHGADPTLRNANGLNAVQVALARRSYALEHLYVRPEELVGFDEVIGLLRQRMLVDQWGKLVQSLQSSVFSLQSIVHSPQSTVRDKS